MFCGDGTDLWLLLRLVSVYAVARDAAQLAGIETLKALVPNLITSSNKLKTTCIR